MKCLSIHISPVELIPSAAVGKLKIKNLWHVYAAGERETDSLFKYNLGIILEDKKGCYHAQPQWLGSRIEVEGLREALRHCLEVNSDYLSDHVLMEHLRNSK